MLLKGMYGFEGADMTFDQCVWSCIALLPPCMILNVTDGTFFLRRPSTVHLKRKTNCFCPSRPSGSEHPPVCTYRFVADRAERLQVIQGALSSSAVHRPDVVNLPEIPLHRSADHLVQLKTRVKKRVCQQTLNPLCYYNLLKTIWYQTNIRSVKS